MDADLVAGDAAVFACLPQFGTLAVTGEDARAFLHGQLSNDVEHLPGDTARRAGYCSAKGRLLASFLVIPCAEGFLLQVSLDIAATVAKRLSMFVLRSKVKIADAGDSLTQFGVWGREAGSLLKAAGFDAPEMPMQVQAAADRIVVSLGTGRYLLLGRPDAAAALAARFAQVAPEWWTLGDVRAGVPLIGQSTQDQFVPQMANFELIGGVDFRKGCYPGQEIVARTQYLGKLKRRMYRGEIEAPGSAPPAAGQDLFDAGARTMGTVVNAAPRPEGGYELLGVLQSETVHGGGPIRLGSADGPIVHIAPLPYAI